MKIWAAECSFPGGREYNEDTVGHGPVKNGYMAIVADGLGGHGGGEQASAAAVDCFMAGYRKKPVLTEENLYRLAEEANKRICTMQTEERKMRTTLVGFFCDSERWASLHVGDSRLYWFQNGRIKFCTLDHSVSQMAALSGEITKEQIRFHPDRNKVLRALGGTKLIRPDITINGGKLEGSSFLLCTDGFWEYVWEEEMAVDLLKSETPKQWLSYLLARIGKRMNEKNDNLSAVAVFIRE